MGKDSINEVAIEERLEQSYQVIVDAFVNRGHLSSIDFFDYVFNAVFELIPSAEKGSYYELDQGFFKPIFARGYDMTVLKKLSFKEEDLFIGFEVNAPGVIEAYEFYNKQRDDSRFTTEEIQIFKALGTYNEFTSLYTPIQVDGANVGLICCERFDGQPYPESSKLILKLFAQLISNFYTQMVHRERERGQFNEIIEAMVTAIEVKDKYTEGHARRVTEYAKQLAIYMRLSNEQVENVSAAAVLHDIGKIGIHSDILVKPGKLTKEEYDLIKEHPGFTKKILQNISGFSEVVDIAYMHHEYYNGLGYPQGLKGQEIPIESAIISVVDAFDSMTTDRSYRKALPDKKAYEIIKEERGKQFNPRVVDAFLQWQLVEVDSSSL